MSLDDTSPDVIYISSLSLSANVGRDWLGHVRPQPLSVSVAIHLQDSSLDSAAAIDDLGVSVHYGQLSKDIIALSEAQSAKWESAAVLAMSVALLASHTTEGRARELRVVVSSAKLVPLASEYAVEFIGYAEALGKRDQTKSTGSRVRVRVKDLVIPAVIGHSSPERDAKQLIVSDIVIFEKPSQVHFADYPTVFNKLSQNFEAQSYLTLEQFALRLVREICLSSDAIEKVSVRAAKPNAFASVNVTGVQICRPRSAFVRSGDKSSSAR
ncbi:hypothetical protein OBBRIDRAFT_86089 [Obba rivulosa]|uniref:dihydroneopterin aldolase n=1 Tax=Obba rivulosa TaxID=1052685 RepID=A0A8E2AUW6_9APHY|nr:hypothetical protein OBBRIDRAFT_86089 [Obba rivulosa]